MKEKLVILEYSTQTVHVYNVDPDANIDEGYISDLGFNTSECAWMFGEDIEIVRHGGLLR